MNTSPTSPPPYTPSPYTDARKAERDRVGQKIDTFISSNDETLVIDRADALAITHALVRGDGFHRDETPDARRF